MTTRTGIAAAVSVLCLSAALVVRAEPQKKAPAGKLTPAQEKALENYKTVCQLCHGPDGKAPIPDMSLNDGQWKHGNTVQAISKTIAEGVPGTAMMPFKERFSAAEIRELAQLVRSFDPKLSGKTSKE